MMDWKQKMAEGMRLMRDACNATDGWDQCEQCPFDKYCTALMEANLNPFEGLTWNSEKDIS